MRNIAEPHGQIKRPLAPAHTFRVLYEVAVATSGVLDPERLAVLAVERARQLTGSSASSLFWWIPERELLVPLAHHPRGPSAAADVQTYGEGAVGAAFTSGQPQVVDGRANPRRLPGEALDEGGASVLAIPLFVDGKTDGVLCVRRSGSARWSQRQIEVLSLLATLVAPALAAARRHADLTASEESFRAVFSDAQDQLLALVRELSVHRTAPTPDGEPISMSEAQALMELRAGEGLSQRSLAMRLRLEKSTVSRLAAQMEARGWLERNRDTNDARLIRLRLTSRGKAMARDLAAMRASRLQGVLDAMPEADRQSFLEALKVVVQALHRGPARRGATASRVG